MPAPIEICLERMDVAEREEAFLRCVALPEIEPGLVLDDQGAVLWMPDRGQAKVTGLWVSGDEQLVLIRGAHTAEVRVCRAGRSVKAPAGKPVVLLDQDVLELGSSELGSSRRLRVHVHGATELVHAPERVPASAVRRLLRAAAAAVALGAATVGCAEVEVRNRPPVIALPTKSLHCTIDSSKAAQQGWQLTLSCPEKGIVSRGMVGTLTDSAGEALPDGRVVVKSIQPDGSVIATVTRKDKPASARVTFVTR
jgi:hypothetical protein